ncbi:dTDP-4-dehydrorhamnose 3,5-epimerase [Azorhizobium sp. AG788]|uniref:dTDP-4-dehydrorhamnose 3,5-epimerase n=1 Tax=Azorhizobium sp. AG788 TaxID=2183897 RepID=UPI003139D339
MKFTETKIPGVVEIDISPFVDARGLFARAFCADTFAAQNLTNHFVNANTSWNPKVGTLRGLHLQEAPHSEAKLVRAVRGKVFDVAVDLRPESPTYCAWTGVELDAERRNALFIPQGCAHGFLTLEDDCELFYLVSDIYAPDLARTYRWDDPAFGISWPSAPTLISDRDAAAEDFRP